MPILTGIFVVFLSTSNKIPNTVVSEIWTWMLPSTSFLIHFSLIILSFNAIMSELLTALLYKQHINKYVQNLMNYGIPSNNR
jgi:hypothetical protein